MDAPPKDVVMLLASHKNAQVLPASWSDVMIAWKSGEFSMLIVDKNGLVAFDPKPNVLQSMKNAVSSRHGPVMATTIIKQRKGHLLH
jgi:hypothetical protein